MKNNLYLLKKYTFESLVLLWLVIYVALYLTPSSYGYVLSQLGMEGDGLLFGTPRAIRADEWSVWTPYIQSLVNSGFQRFNTLSIYHEDFRNFNSLPIFDWALFFKPYYWAFLFTEPARAFSFFHGFTIAAFLIGWKQLFVKLLGHYIYASEPIFILFTFLLYFSGFVQGWWTTLGPVLAFFPWLLLVLCAWKHHSLKYYLLLVYVATTWLLSQLYPPIIVSCAYLGICLIAAFQPEFFRSPSRIIMSLLSCLVSILIVAYYFKDIIPVMIATVYPGQRISSGGEVPWFLWLASFIPYISHSYLEPLRQQSNICEVGVVSSVLPLLAISFLEYKSITIKKAWDIKVLSCGVLFFSIWMLFPIPVLLSKIFLLSMIPGARLFFVLGLLVNIIALVTFLKYGTCFSYKRGIIYLCLLLISWNVPIMYTNLGLFQKSALELFSLPLVLGLIFLSKNKIGMHKALIGVVFIACLVNILYFFKFNPLQSAQPIFNTQRSPILQHLKEVEQQDARGWLVINDYNGAVLNGLGLKSFSHTLIQPQLNFFRKLFPELSGLEFNRIFNRYAHIKLYTGSRIQLSSADMISIPLNRVGGVKSKKKEWLLSPIQETNDILLGGALDAISIHNNQLILTGWVMSENYHFATNLNIETLHVKFTSLARPDVVQALQDNNLLFSGFKVVILLSNKNIETIKREGFCLQSISNTYGVRTLNRKDGVCARARSVIPEG